MARPVTRPSQVSSGAQPLTEEQWVLVLAKITEARSKLNTLKHSVAKMAKEMATGDDQKSVLMDINSHNYLLLHLMFQLLNLSLMFSWFLVDQNELITVSCVIIQFTGWCKQLINCFIYLDIWNLTQGKITTMLTFMQHIEAFKETMLCWMFFCKGSLLKHSPYF